VEIVVEWDRELAIATRRFGVEVGRHRPLAAHVEEKEGSEGGEISRNPADLAITFDDIFGYHAARLTDFGDLATTAADNYVQANRENADIITATVAPR